jgi:hypothetical protein
MSGYVNGGRSNIKTWIWKRTFSCCCMNLIRIARYIKLLKSNVKPEVEPTIHEYGGNFSCCVLDRVMSRCSIIIKY